MDEKDCNKLYTKGVNKLKTSFFSFKFSPDYLGAVDDFTSSAKGYRKLGLSNKSIAASAIPTPPFHTDISIS